MDDHPTTDDFSRLLASCPQPSSTERNALAIRHLLAGCPVCHATLKGLRGVRPLLSRLLDIPLTPLTAGVCTTGEARPLNYDWAFARANRGFIALLAGDRPSEHLPALLTELASLPEGEQLRRVEADSRFTDPSFIRCLIDRSHAARYQSPRRTLHFARLAMLAASSCIPETTGGEEPLSDLRSEAWRALANAQRICGNFPEAEKSFALALQHLKSGTGSLRPRALLLAQLSPLRLAQGRFQDTIELTEEGGRIYEELAEEHLLASTMVQQAIVLVELGYAETALEILQRAVPRIDRGEDPRLFLAAQHNLAHCYIVLDRPEEALALHFKARELYQECPDPLIILRAIWQEGRLLREIGHLHNAEAALLRSREGFIEHHLAYEAGLVSLDLAEVYLKLGQTAKLRQTVEEAVPIFRTLRVGQEVPASLLRLQQIIGEAPEQEAS